jgi:magnesium transporter
VIETDPVQVLAARLAAGATEQAVPQLVAENTEKAARALERSSPARAVALLWALSEERRRALLAAATPEWAQQWTRNHAFEADTIGRMMAPARAVMPPTLSIAEAIERLRDVVSYALVSYVFVVDGEDKLVGVLVFRDMLLASRDQKLSEVMIRNPFYLTADMPILDAMRAVLSKHHPSYPVCDAEGRLVGVMRGETLFQQQAFELSAQSGSMVGIQKEERLATPWATSLRLRHPWLHLNLATAFLAAAVVGVFQDTIDRFVVLAIFLPVLAGQAGNTGAQALAVTLRGMTLGELQKVPVRTLLSKEAWLGLVNGALVGVTAGAAMYFYAAMQALPAAGMLAFVVAVAMIGSCLASGLTGVLVPLVLRRFGTDPATASSIFLTTATDCVSMGALLALAAALIGG